MREGQLRAFRMQPLRNVPGERTIIRYAEDDAFLPFIRPREMSFTGDSEGYSYQPSAISLQLPATVGRAGRNTVRELSAGSGERQVE